MAENEEKSGPEEKAAVAVEDHVVESHHSLRIGEADVAYTAHAGTLVLREENEAGEHVPKAKLFFVAYTRDDVADVARRPITFSFNGGPGSSSVWLHLGLLGPRRVNLGEEGYLPPPPYALEDNAFSLLDETDLVFIDPVTTGFSRTVSGEEAKQFHDFKKDLESVGEFIRVFTTRYGRWTSPKFLIGESYGTTRAAALSGHLQQRHGMYFNGVILISSVLNFQTVRFGTGNDLPYMLFLPTYAATAWYHQRVDRERYESLETFLGEVESFALNDYAIALIQGTALPPEESSKLAGKLAAYTGLSREYVERSNLRIDIHRFTKELLRERRRTVGRLDSRFTGIDRDAAGEKVEFDPSYANIQGPYTATLNDYVRRELRFESDLPYEILTGRVQPWRYGEHENSFVDVGETLRQAMSMNPFLKVFIGSGYYDLATPYLATRYTVNHLHLDAELQANVTMADYPAGHMMYIQWGSLERLKHDLVNFLRQAVSP